MKTSLTNADISLWPQPSARNPEPHQRGQPLASGEMWVQRGRSFHRQVCTAWMILKDPRTPWYARAVAACTVGYLFSPVQLIPSFIPVIGFLDDVAVLWIGFRLIPRVAPAAVLHECNEPAARVPPISSTEMKLVARMAALAVALV